MPFTQDGAPIIGKVNCIPGNAFIITGMSSAGMMQGPASGLFLAHLINGNQEAKDLLKPADPDRVIKTIQQPTCGIQSKLAKM